MNLLKSIFFALFVLVSVTVSAQNKFTKKGNEAFEKRYWHAAIDNYTVALKKEQDKELKKLITYRVAQSYDKMKNFKNAVAWYQKLIKKGKGFVDTHPEVYLKLADALKKMELYNEAMAQYMEYQGLKPEDPKGVKGAKSCQLAMKWIQHPTRYKVANVQQLNTKYDDAIPNYASKNKKAKNIDIIFQSYREGGLTKDENNVNGQAYPDLYISKVNTDNGQWDEPVMLPAPVNTKFAEGSPAFNKKCTVLYFSRCENHKDEVKGCDLYKSTKTGQGYGEPVKLEMFEDSSATENFHPCISADDSKLYFVSNMKGGQGGYDIWVADWDKKEKKFLVPKNMGKGINTDGNEYYPYLHDDGTLYFSSDGHIGIGGLDLFRAEKEDDGFGPVVNLKVPLNSSGDDVSITFNAERERGFISSNRKGTKGRVDIWSFVLPEAEVFVKGIVTECGATPIANAKVILRNESDKSTEELMTKADGTYEFKLIVGYNYSISVTSDSSFVNAVGTNFKKYFAADVRTVNVIGIDESKTFIEDICLEVIPEKGIELPNIVYVYTKFTLTADARKKLTDELLPIMQQNPTLVIELGSHTDYRGTDENNRILAQNRAQSVVDFMIKSGVDSLRMVAFGYGEKTPKTLDSAAYVGLSPVNKGMFSVGDVMDEKFIAPLKRTNKVKWKAAHQINRRTEFKVLRTDYGVEAKEEEGK